jgi:hypothetical protein
MHQVQAASANAKQQAAASAAVGAAVGATVGAAAAGAAVGSAAQSAPPGTTAACVTGTTAATSIAAKQRRCGSLRLYQVLAPKLVERAHLFGNKLALGDGTTCHDLPFFCAPAAASTATLDPLRQQLAAGQTGVQNDRRGSGSGSGSRTVSALLLRRRQQLLPAVSAVAGATGTSQAGLAATAASKHYDVPAAGHMSAAAGRDAVSGTGSWWRRQKKQQQQQQGSAAHLGGACAPTDAGSAVVSAPKNVGQSCVHVAQSHSQHRAGLAVAAGLGKSLQAAESAVTFVFCSVVSPRTK